MSLTTRVLAGLVAGFLLGLALARAPSWIPASPAASITTAIIAIVTPIGTIFVNLIRMTIIPLVVSMLVASVGRITATGVLAGVGVRAATIAVAMLAVAASGSLIVARPVLARVRVDQAAALALGAASASAASNASGSPAAGRDLRDLRDLRGTAPGMNVAPDSAEHGESGGALSALARWVVDLVPANIARAASDGAMLPVIVFSVLFGVALARVRADHRDAVLHVAQGVADAMQRLVGGILELAPIGVFALAVPLASRLGLTAVGAVAAYIVLVVTLTVAVGVLLLYPVGMIGGRMSLPSFIDFCAPAQAVAFASRSSLAALPAMVESAERAGMPALVSGFLLPLAASVFRMGAAVAQTVGVLFLARLYGVTLSPPQLVTVVVTVVFTSFAVPGIPGGSIIAMVPVLAAVNLPVEGIGVLLAVDTIPDMFRTTENVTGSLTLAALRVDRARGTPAGRQRAPGTTLG